MLKIDNKIVLTCTKSAMATKYEKLLGRLQKFKESRESSSVKGEKSTAPCKPAPPSAAAPANRRQTFLVQRNTITSTGADRRKSMANVASKRKCSEPVAGAPKNKRAKEQDSEEMRKKLEEWRRKKEKPKSAPANVERRRTFIPTGPYGVSFGFDIEVTNKQSAQKSHPNLRKSLPASQKPGQKTQLSRKSLCVVQRAHPPLSQSFQPLTQNPRPAKSQPQSRKSLSAVPKTQAHKTQAGSRKSLAGMSTRHSPLASKRPQPSSNVTALKSRSNVVAAQKKAGNSQTSKKPLPVTSAARCPQPRPVYSRTECTVKPKPTPKRVLSTAKENTIDKTPRRVQKLKEEPKKKKLKYVQSRTDTGLSVLKRDSAKHPVKLSTTSKTAGGKTLDARPAWNFTPKVSATVSRISAMTEAAVSKPEQALCQKRQSVPTAPAPAKIVRPVQKKGGEKRRSILKAVVTDDQKENVDGDCHVRFAEEQDKTEKLTAQEKQKNMRDRLDNWLKEHGKTPSKYSTLRNFHSAKNIKSTPKTLQQRRQSPRRQSMEFLPLFPEAEDEEEEEEEPVVSKLNQLLAECLLLLDSGCPVSAVCVWLDEVVDEAGMSVARRCAKYWICRARLEEQQAQHTPATVIDIYEQAIRQQVKKPDEIAEALKQYVSRLGQQQAPVAAVAASKDSPVPHTPRRRSSRLSSQLPQDAIFRSSAIKYSMMEATTPFFNRLRSQVSQEEEEEEGATGTLAPHAVVTPVRRSTRVTPHRPRPAVIQEHRTVVDELDELPSHLHLLYQANNALAALAQDSDDDEEEGDMAHDGSYLM